MTSGIPQSTGAWVSHVNGAFALVQLRGRNQFERPLAIQLLVRLCTNLLISCVASHQPLPPDFLHLRASVAEFIDSRDAKWQLGGLMLRFAELRSAAKSRFLSPCQVINLAKNLDLDFVALADDMPPSWQYETVLAKGSSPHVFDKCFHVYRNVHVTQTWNVLRLGRIMIMEIVLGQYSQLSGCLTPSSLDDETTQLRDCEAAKESIHCMAVDICASVPQYTGLRSKTVGESHVDPAQQQQQQSNMCCCYTLIFPLFVAAQSPTTSSNIRNCILLQLRHMSQDLGVRNAALILGLLERGEWVEPWSVYATLGGYAFVA